MDHLLHRTGNESTYYHLENRYDTPPPIAITGSHLTRDGDRQCGKTDESKDSAALLGQHSQATGHRGGFSHNQRHVNMYIDRYIYK